jgi:hypothetical protein
MVSGRWNSISILVGVTGGCARCTSSATATAPMLGIGNHGLTKEKYLDVTLLSKNGI